MDRHKAFKIVDDDTLDMEWRNNVKCVMDVWAAMTWPNPKVNWRPRTCPSTLLLAVLDRKHAN